jgi:DNA-binding NarL/FixJ family response regulator
VLRPAGAEDRAHLSPIRVLIVDMPGVLHDIVNATLAAARDIVVVGDVTDVEESLERVVEAVGPSVVVLGSGHPAAADGCRELLSMDSNLKLIALDDDGAQTFLVEMRPKATPLGELSPSTLVSAIRSAAVPA